MQRIKDLWIWLLAAAAAGFLAAYLIFQQPKILAPQSATVAPTSSPAAFLEEPSKGSPDAPIVIIEFSDFKCPFCLRHFIQTLPLLEKEYIQTGKVRYIYRNFPILGTQSSWAALAGECAHEQGRFWDYHNKLFMLEGASEGTFVRSRLKAIASELGLDTARFDQCVDSDKYLQEVQEDYRAGQDAGVTGTPGFLINGQLVVGAQPIEAFQQIVEEELEKKK